MLMTEIGHHLIGSLSVLGHYLRVFDIHLVVSWPPTTSSCAQVADRHLSTSCCPCAVPTSPKAIALTPREWLTTRNASTDVSILLRLLFHSEDHCCFLSNFRSAGCLYLNELDVAIRIGLQQIFLFLIHHNF